MQSSLANCCGLEASRRWRLRSRFKAGILRFCTTISPEGSSSKFGEVTCTCTSEDLNVSLYVASEDHKCHTSLGSVFVDAKAELCLYAGADACVSVYA